MTGARQSPGSAVPQLPGPDNRPAGPAGADSPPVMTASSADVVLRRARLGRRAVRGVRDYVGALAALVVIVIIISSAQSGFLTVANLQNVFQTNAPLFLVSIGMTFVVISGGFDLSVGAMMAVSEESLLLLINDAHINAPLAVVITIAICGLLGALLNGAGIGILKLNFFVTTLGTMILLQGIVLVASNGVTNVVASPWLQSLGNNAIGVIPIPVLICIGLLILAWFVLQFTAFGRSVYCVGGNPEAARMSGISVPSRLLVVYGISGMCGAMAGVVDAGRLSAATPTAGSTIALTSAAAVLLGGASLAGGVGKVAGTTIGVLVLAVLGNGVNLFGVSAYWQDVVTGAVLLIAIVLDRANKSGLLLRLGSRDRFRARSRSAAQPPPTEA
jgi:ribose transport system permease protein